MRSFTGILLVAVSATLLYSANGATIKIGGAFEFKGAFSTEGSQIFRGITLYMEMINNAGGVVIGGVPHYFNLTRYETGDPDLAVRTNNLKAAYARMYVNDSMDFAIGPFGTAGNLAISPVTHALKKILMMPGSGDQLFSRGHNMSFSALPSTRVWPNKAVQTLLLKGARTFFITFKDDPFTESQANFTRQQVLLGGGTVIGFKKYPAPTGAAGYQELAIIMKEAKAANPDVFVGAGVTEDFPIITGLHKFTQLNTKASVFMGTYASESQDVLGNAEGFVNPNNWHYTFKFGVSGKYGGTVSEFSNAFLARYGEMPASIMAYGLGNLIALHAAIEKAQSLNHDSVVAALRTLNFQCLLGNVRFTPTGSNEAKEPEVTQMIFNKSKSRLFLYL